MDRFQLYEYHPSSSPCVPLFRPARDRPAAPVTERQVGGHGGLLLPRQRHPRTQLHMEEEWEEAALHRLEVGSCCLPDILIVPLVFAAGT